MAGADPRNVGLSKNCLDAVEEFATLTSEVNDDNHMCFDHKHERSCKHLEDFGRSGLVEAKEKMWKWCFIRPQRNRSEGK